MIGKNDSRKESGFLLILFLFILTFSSHIYALPGDLDITFDADGKVSTAVGTGDDAAFDAVIQPDGKIVVAGQSLVGTNDFALVRYNTDGSLDTSFGSGGKVLISEPSEQRANALVIQSDGKIIVVGTAVGNTPFTTLAVYRFNADGSLDSTFNNNGKAVIDIGDKSEGNDVVIQPDGKIVIAGDINQALAVFRLNADGTLDTNFNGIGYRSFPLGGVSTTTANAVALQADGKIIAGGRFTHGNFGGVWIRLNSDGTIDGTETSVLGTIVRVRDIAIQPDGKIVFGGSVPSIDPPYEHLGVARYNSDKTIDSSFGNNGSKFANFGVKSFGNGLVIQSDGRIVVGGYIESATYDFALARFNTNGFLDVGFGNSGKVVTQFGDGDDRINALALQADSKIVAVGQTYNGTNFDFAVARYDGGGSTTLANRTPFDFDGDGRADIGVFRPSNSVWYQLLGVNYQFSAFSFGLSGDIIAPADFDGDGRTDLGIFRPSTGTWWYAASSQGGAFQAVQWGQSGDVPLPSDVNGNGRDDFVVYRPSNNTWYRLTDTGQSSTRVFGSAGDKPLIGDFDGDGKADPAIFRPSTGTWWYAASSQNDSSQAIQWGIAEDIPAAADFDGDGRTDTAVYRPSSGVWYILNSGNQTATIIQFGLSGDKPVAADYDGDGKADIAVYRPSTGEWYILRSTAGFFGLQFGIAEDIPVPNAFVP